MTNQTNLANKATTSTSANDLVFVSEDHNHVLTSSEIIAKALDKQHKDVLELIHKYEKDISEISLESRITFKTWKGEPLPQGGFAKSKQVALLTEEQATLLITYMRNTEKVRKFKIALVKAFFEMKKYLSSDIPAKTNTIVVQDIENAISDLDDKIDDVHVFAETINKQLKQQQKSFLQQQKDFTEKLNQAFEMYKTLAEQFTQKEEKPALLHYNKTTSKQGRPRKLDIDSFITGFEFAIDHKDRAKARDLIYGTLKENLLTRKQIVNCIYELLQIRDSYDVIDCLIE